MDFMSLITDIVVDDIHNTTDCIAARDSHGIEKGGIGEPTPLRSATKQDTWAWEEKVVSSTVKPRTWRHTLPGYRLPQRSTVRLSSPQPMPAEPEATYMYHWLFLSFFTLTLYRPHTLQTKAPQSSSDRRSRVLENGDKVEVISEIIPFVSITPMGSGSKRLPLERLLATVALETTRRSLRTG